VLKPSEIVPRTAQLVAQAVAEAFDPSELAVVQGGPEVAAAFSAQPWDHLVFTGATSVGRQVMKAAAENLVPVTLELGGKSPVVVGRSAELRNAAERIAVGKGQNAGQLCVSPDVVWVAREQMQPFVAALREVYDGLFTTARDNPDVVPVVNERHFARVQGYLADAQARGASVQTAGGADGGDATNRRLPLSIVIDPAADSEIARHEIFGPASMTCSCTPRCTTRRLAVWATRAWAITTAVRASWSSATRARSTRPARTTPAESGGCCLPTVRTCCP
jgi:coniferyl-aldehyde dehydrogenase